MNRKLRNTILAFSVTGTVLALGLLAARPAMPGDAMTPAALVAEAASLEHAKTAAAAEADGTRIRAAASARAASLSDLEAAAIDDIEERILARSRQFEDDIVDARSLEGAMALTAGLVATAATEAVIAELRSGNLAAPTGTERADPDTASTPRRRRSVRGAVAVPYFSFARGTGRGGRS